jgi:hypothetical protein
MMIDHSTRRGSALAANAKRRVKLAIGFPPPAELGGGGKFQLVTD